jgi:hypothetical protein
MRKLLLSAWVLGVVAALALAAPAQAHEQRDVADHSMVVGWADEPTFSGFKNAVQVFVNEHGTGGQEEGPAVEDAEMEVEVLFGGEDAEESIGPFPLEPAFGSPGEYLATLVPTRPGQYTFHITGTLGGEEFDEFFTSGPDTFSEVADPADIEFPVQDPTRGDLASGVQQLQAENADLQQQVAEAQEAQDAADTARLLAIIGIAAGVIGLVVAVAALARRRPAAA